MQDGEWAIKEGSRHARIQLRVRFTEFQYFSLRSSSQCRLTPRLNRLSFWPYTDSGQGLAHITSTVSHTAAPLLLVFRGSLSISRVTRPYMLRAHCMSFCAWLQAEVAGLRSELLAREQQQMVAAAAAAAGPTQASNIQVCCVKRCRVQVRRCATCLLTGGLPAARAAAGTAPPQQHAGTQACLLQVYR